MMGQLIATVHRQSDASKQNRRNFSHGFMLQPSHPDNAADVILLRKCLDAGRAGIGKGKEEKGRTSDKRERRGPNSRKPQKP